MIVVNLKDRQAGGVVVNLTRPKTIIDSSRVVLFGFAASDNIVLNVQSSFVNPTVQFSTNIVASSLFSTPFPEFSFPVLTNAFIANHVLGNVVTDRWSGLSPAVNISLSAPAPSAVGERVVENILSHPETAIALLCSSQDIGQRLSYSPGVIFDGYEFDGTNIIIPISSFVGVTQAEADAIDGSWLEIVQGAFLAAHELLSTLNPYVKPKTADIFLLENYNANHPTLGRGAKRKVNMSFNTKFAAPKITEE